MQRFLIVTALASVWGQAPAPELAPRGIPVKALALEYEFHGDAGKIGIGALYMGRSFAAAPHDSEDKQRTVLFDAGSFLVVELGAFASKGFTGEVHIGDFALRIDGQKSALTAAGSGIVRNTLRTQSAAAQSHRTQGFPGDPQPQQRRPPGAEPAQENPQHEWDAALESSFPEGKLQSSRAGNLFFFFPGKTAKLKSMTLEYNGEGGKLEIKLR